MATHPPFKSRRAAVIFGLGLLVAALAPLQSRSPKNPSESIRQPTWPDHIEGRAVRELPLSEVEERFAAEFPGRIKRLTDGRRVFILRWVTRPTRKLHPAADCLRGLGFEIIPGGTRIDDGHEWGAFTATRSGATMHVTERIWDAMGNSWPDVTAWFWAAALRRSHGPWWAMTVVE